MKHVPLPLRIWPLADAPKRYRALLREEEDKNLIDNETRVEMKWVASLKGKMAQDAFWGTRDNTAAAKGSFAHLTRSGVLFHRTDLPDEVVSYFSDNNEEVEIDAGM